MRKFRAASPLVVGLGGSGAASSLLTNLVGYWKLDETSGNRADSSGLGSTLIATGIAINSRTGKISNGPDFIPSDSSWLRCASNSNLEMGDIDFTMVAWVWLDTTAINQCAMSKDNGSKFDYMFYSVAGTTWHFYLDYATSGFADVPWGSTVAASSWHFLVGVHDSVNNLAKLSLDNGTFVTTSTGGNAPVITTTSSNLNIAAYAAGSNLLDGIVDEVGIWKRALSASEITSLYNSGAGLTYPF